jgi:hypothetical protein
MDNKLLIINVMPGGLINIFAYGAQDIYLTSNPTINFFHIQWSYEYRILSQEDRNTECPVTLEPITGDYATCDECKYNISLSVLDTLSHMRKDTFNCPMCRTKWTSTIIYINRNSDEQI